MNENIIYINDFKEEYWIILIEEYNWMVNRNCVFKIYYVDYIMQTIFFWFQSLNYILRITLQELRQTND